MEEERKLVGVQTIIRSLLKWLTGESLVGWAVQQTILLSFHVHTHLKNIDGFLSRLTWNDIALL